MMRSARSWLPLAPAAFAAALAAAALCPNAAGAQTASWSRPPGPAPSPVPASASAQPPTVADLARAVALVDQGRGPEALAQARAQARRGSGPAAALAGHLLERGLAGVGADLAAAAAEYRIGAQLNDLDCLEGLGRLGAAGSGGVGAAEARDALSRAVAGGRTTQAASLATLLLDPAAGAPEPARAEALLSDAAARGDGEAAYALAVLRDDGDPAVADNPASARALLNQAAEAGLAPGQADLGLLMYQGRGGPRDLAGAVRLFGQAARGGDRDGAFYFALMLARGEGIARNEAEALQWARQARGSSPEADRLLTQLERRAGARSAPAPR